MISLQASNDHLQASNDHLQAANDRLQATVDRLQAEKQEQVRGLEELTTLQQQQLEIQRREIDQLSGQLRSLKLHPREEGSQGSRRRDVSVASPKHVRQALMQELGMSCSPHNCRTCGLGTIDLGEDSRPLSTSLILSYLTLAASYSSQ